MTIESNINKVFFVGNGVSNTLSVTYPYFNKSDVKVYKEVSGVSTLLQLDTDYTLENIEDVNGEISGGTITFKTIPEVGVKIAAVRELPFTQEVDYRENDIFPAETLEDALDKLTMITQQLQEENDRSVKLTIFSETDPAKAIEEIERVYSSVENIDIVAKNETAVKTTADNIDYIIDAPNQANKAEENAEKAEKSATSAVDSARTAQLAAAQSSQASGKVIQIGFDGFMENGQLVFKHSPAGVDIPYDLLDDYEYEIDMAYSDSDLADDIELVVKNGADTINFVSALHRDSTTPVTVKDMKSVMRYDERTGYRWLFKAAFKVTPSGNKVLLLYPVISVGGSGTGRNIGDIFYTSRLDNELNGAVEANGGVYAVADFTGEQSAPALLAEGKLPVVSMAEYESIVSANGSCRAWGWDNGDTFRVPTVKALLLTKEQASVVGNGMTLGLNNGIVSGALVSRASSGLDGFTTQYGSDVGITVANSEQTMFDASSGLWKTTGVTTDPEKSGIVANLDVIEYRAMIQLSTGATDEALMTCTGVLSDVAELKGHAIVETYRNGTEWYRIYADGWCEQGGVVANTGANHVATISLLKPYADTNYIVTVGQENSAGARSVADVGIIGTKTTSNFQSYQYNDVIINWIACGQGA